MTDTPTAPEERDFAHVGSRNASFHAEDTAASAAFRAEYATRSNVVTSEEQPFENSADGLIKHLVHHKMNTRECCVEAYMQFIEAGGHSGKHRHMWEEVLFVAEGEGYDLHWDLKFDCVDEFEWEWAETPKRFAWKRGDFIYVPPFTAHQHFNDGAEEARLIVISNRITKEMGFDWFDQLDVASSGTPEA
jgi:gentisate 1,2-dioxygenase